MFTVTYCTKGKIITSNGWLSHWAGEAQMGLRRGEVDGSSGAELKKGGNNIDKKNSRNPLKRFPEGIRFHFLSISSVQFSSVAHVRLFATPWIVARQASPSITNSRSSLKLMSIESVMPSSHLILCRPLLLPPIPPSIRVFSNEPTLRMRWPKYWSFSFSIIPSKEIPGLSPLEWTGWISLQSGGCEITVQHGFNWIQAVWAVFNMFTGHLYFLF